MPLDSSPFGNSVSSFIANFSSDDHLAPQITSDFATLFPTDPLEGTKGTAVSSFVHELFPTDPTRPAELGSNLSAFIAIIHGPDIETDGGIGTDGGLLFMG